MNYPSYRVRIGLTITILCLSLLCSGTVVGIGEQYVSPFALVMDKEGKSLYIAEYTAYQVAVFDIAGDGSIQMNIQELATAVHDKIHVKVAILNNCYLGMVRQWQELFYKRRYSYTHICSPDFVKLAESYGAVGIRATKKEEVRPAIEKALSVDNVVLIDFNIEQEENVFPMVPAGEAIDRMIGGMA